ncbi:unnamed protein product [Brassica rapa subsp. narinosa]
MKMLKEYAELLVDIEDFMSYPWGRLAFDMLMTSIKNRDEIALSQNTIALKGFALALQLVIAEAVPSLTEVVQDACSSSESESEDEETEYHVSKARRKTLNPAHAREVDRKAEVVVSSIIPQDPQRPLDESVLIWADEVFDKEVENLVKLISQKFVFTKDMFKGGATSSDVQKMREALKNGRTNKQKRQLETESVGSADDKLASVVQALLQPEIKRIDGNVSAGIASMKELASTSLDYKDSVLASVFEMIKDMKSEILGSLTGGYAHNGEVGFEGHHISPSTDNVSIAGSSKHPDGGGDDENANTIDNVLENLSHYSTPPGSPQICPVRLSVVSKRTSKLLLGYGSPSVPVVDSTRRMHALVFFQTGEPSFSLGLTQENAASTPHEADPMVENATQVGVGSHHDTPNSRKSKRMRIVPPYLLTGYHCGSTIINRARQGQLCGGSYYEMSVIREKYVRLCTLLKKPCMEIPYIFVHHFSVINVGGISVTQKDILDIADRKRFLPGKANILMRLVRSTFDIQVMGKTDVSAAFLDTRFASLLSRNYHKFKIQKNKSGLLFSKSLVDAVMNSCQCFTPSTRFYLPFCIGKKHWIGLCLDFSESKLYVFDCNPGLTAETALLKDIQPIAEMFPNLVKQCGVSVAGGDTPLVVERVEGVAKNPNPGDSGITTAIMIQTHSLFGIDPCLAITPSVIAKEAQRAAVMLYEFHAKL